MGTNYDLTMKQYNGTDYDTLRPTTSAEQIEITDSDLLTKFGLTSGDTVGDAFAAMIDSTSDYFVRLADIMESYGYTVLSSGSATVPAGTSWSQNTTTGLYYCTVSISSFAANTTAFIMPRIDKTDVDTGQAQQEAWNKHYYSVTVSGGITFYAVELPDVAVTFDWQVAC